MPLPGQSWPLKFKVIACFFHILAISSGIFRSTYRWHISRFGWDDGWAVLALCLDVVCLICSWLQRSVPLKPSRTDMILNWIITIALTSTAWGARLSMITAIIRIINPYKYIRHMSYAIAIAFGLMWTAILVLKMYACGTRLCRMPHELAISQAITDGISDAFLVLMPTFFLQRVKISQSQRILLLSSFASSICITIISVAQVVSLFHLTHTGVSVLLTHIKAALSVVICNLLVLVTFAYRFYRKMDIDLSESSIESDLIQFTTVILSQINHGSCSCTTSLPRSCNYCISSSRTQTNDVSPIPTRGDPT